jgi:hypothetical protein
MESDGGILSDVDLENCSGVMELVISFLEARGSYWYLATNPLKKDLERLRGIVESRRPLSSDSLYHDLIKRFWPKNDPATGTEINKRKSPRR